MANIVEVNNPFEPLKDTIVYEVTGGRTIHQILCERYGASFVCFERPTICIVDGNPIPQDQWKKFIISENGIVNFIRLQGALYALYWLYAVLVVAVVALALTMPKPRIPGSTPEPDPVYDLSGQRNQTRLGNPIEVPYGRNRLWPSYAAKAYNEYFNNDQFQYQLFCIGQGVYDIEAVQIEDTPIDNFQDVTYEIYEPGETVELFPDNVVTSSEIGGIELLGSNETGYAGPVGPFVLTPPGTLSYKLEVDLTYPGGLFRAGDNGKLAISVIHVLVEYQEIDGSGTPVGGWLEFFTLNKEMATNTPQRFTLLKEVTPGRYQVRANRTNVKDTDARATNTVRWDAGRAFLPSTRDYGNVTMLAIRARANNNLNNNSSNRINVIATRKLPIWNGSAWSAPTATRSLVWAFADVFRNTNYGGQIADPYLDLAGLLALDAIYTESETWFDFVFDQRGGVWDSAQLVARVGRAVPMLNGSQITMVRDFAKTIPTAVFNQENIVQGSFRWDIKLAGPQDYDGLEIEYVDPVSFLAETVLCLVDGEEGNNPEQVKFPGCTNRDRAWQEGMYMRETALKLRENISFSTALEGRIPTYGDLIKVVHDVPRWGTGGLVVAVAGDNKTLTLNEPVDFSAGGTHKVALRKKNGDVLGPVVATAGEDDFHIVLDTAIDTSNFFFDHINEKPLFLFGPDSGNSGTLCTVVGLAPGDDDTVEVKCTIYNSVIFSHDSDTPGDPPAGGTVPTTPTIARISCGSVGLDRDPITPSQFVMSWNPVPGATGYRVQRSADNATWNDEVVTSSTFHRLIASPGENLFTRVQALSVAGSGPFCDGPPPGGGTVPPLPPVGGGDYWDLVQLAGAAVVLIDCKIRGGGAALCGYREFTDPSTPPKFYRVLTNSGTTSEEVFQPSLDCDPATSIGRTDSTGDKVCTVDRLTCGITQTGSVGTCGHPAAGTGFYNTTLTKTKATTVGAGCFAWSGIQSRRFAGTALVTLSDEDLESDAIDRLRATLADWSSLDWGSLTCYSEQSIRSDDSFSFQECKIRVRTSGLNASGLSLVRVFVSRMDLTTMLTELAEEHAFSTYTDSFGGAEFEFDLPVVSGYRYSVSDIKCYQL